MNHALFALGGLICVTNFYLSFLRHPVLLARSVPRERIRHVSGFPLVGSALVAVALFLGLHGALRVAAWLLILLDTGGPHWFAVALARQYLRERRRRI